MLQPVENLPWHQFLNRPPLPETGPECLEQLRDQTILITGAGGSIGSALAQHIAQTKTCRLILLESSENSLNDLNQRLHQSKQVVSILGSVSDEHLLDELFLQFRPTLIFHAAAHKHVALLEHHPLAAVQNNIFGTLLLAAKAQAEHCRIVLVSTDKASAPSSILGATKQIAERIVLARNGSAIRLGNVLGSRGSVVETFIQQVANRQPLTISHIQARRYFLTLTESVHLLLRTASNTKPGLMAADLSHTSLILDLAKFIAQQLAPGWRPIFTQSGLLPGEKLIETLNAPNEQAARESQGGLRQIEPAPLQDSQLDLALRDLAQVTANRDIPGALEIITALIPDYRPSSTIKSLAATAQPRVFAS